MRIQNTFVVKKKQKGATLVTAMVFLVLMTIVGVSASRNSAQDALIAGNDQQRVEVRMSSAAVLRKKTTAYTVISNMPEDTDSPIALEDDSINGVTVKTSINRPDVYSYNCAGIDDRANSLGPDINCIVFDVVVRGYKEGSGAKNELVQGVGKEHPNVSDSSYLD